MGSPVSRYERIGIMSTQTTHAAAPKLNRVARINSPSPGRVLALVVAMAVASFAASSLAAERLGDITVSPQSLFSGDTHHGYRELRVVLDNHSARAAHRVTLIMPDRPYSYGNSIARVSRTVSVAPGARVVVPLWQPPLPQNGNNSLRVVVDNERPELVSYPSISHLGQPGSRYGGPTIPATVLVSRGVNYDDLNRSLKGVRVGLLAEMAAGPPDSRSRRGLVATAWSPEPSASGPHWIELDFSPAIQADRMSFFDTIGTPSSGEIILMNAAGTNLYRLPISAGSGFLRPGVAQTYSFPKTAEAVAKVRLDFGHTYPGSISVDAVGLEDSTTGAQVWGASARASSENTSGVGVSSGSPSQVRELLRSEVPISEWSEYWLSYSPFDGIAVSAEDLRSMPPAVSAALQSYVECGGVLMVFGGGDIPQTWRSYPMDTVDGGSKFGAGFGLCFALSSPTFSMDTSRSIMAALSASSRRWDGVYDENSANSVFPVVENVRVPVRGIVLIMLAFVVTIGPANYIVLSRLQRRIWLLWTIPLISVLTTGIVFGYSVLREGFTPDSRIESITYLDQVHRRASTLGMSAFYCPLTPGQGLFFSAETEATPRVALWDYSSSSPREVDWTDGQHLERGWVSARVPAHFVTRKAESRRERLQLERTGNGLAVVNGLGAGVTSLWLCDESGRIFSATGVPAGQRADLDPEPGAKQNEVGGPRWLVGPRFFVEKAGVGPFDFSVMSNAPSYLAPGTYIAELKSNPFLENALGPKAESARARARTVVYGALEPMSKP